MFEFIFLVIFFMWGLFGLIDWVIRGTKAIIRLVKYCLKRLGLISEESFDPDKYFVGKKLLYLYEKALEGDVLAQIRLGSAMVYESKIPKVRLRGIDWLRKAAQSGLADAQHELGICLLLVEDLITDRNEHDAAMEESREMLRAAKAQQAKQRPTQRRKRQRIDLIRRAVLGTTCRRRRDSDLP